MINLSWITKGNVKSSSDVSIKILKDNRVSIIFRNNTDLTVTTNKKIEIATLNNRMYFRKGKEDGYSISRKNASGSGFVVISGVKQLIDFVEKYKGNYELKYDKGNKLFYIECEVQDEQI
ncbi:MAG: hypothetical protein PHT76_15535 [Anaerostipes sp.]|jgi:hypothetical protein|nr:hypothetical protein [Anaerostipes sp.]